LRAEAFLASLLFASAVLHVGLYGWRRAPANEVHLSRKHWLFVALIVTPLALTAILVFCFRAWLVPRFGAEAMLSLVLACFGGLVGALYGMAPSYRESDGTGEAPSAGTA